MKKKSINNNLYEKVNNNLINFSNITLDGVCEKLDTTINGLKQEKVDERIDEYGKNEPHEEKKTPVIIQFLKAFANPFIFVLLAIAIISTFINVILAAPKDRSWTEIIIIGIMISVSGIISFSQEYKSQKAAEQLKALVKTTCAVKRYDTDFEEKNMTELVPGDIIKLAAGDMIPADLKIIACKDLFISQSSLTGESEPVEKFEYNDLKTSNIADLKNICLLGTNVISGTAVAVVIGTGQNTYFGTMQTSLSEKKEKTSFDKGVDSVSKLLIKFMIVMVPVVFIINWFDKGSFLSALMFAISVAVGLTPEMLPMIVSANLAKGALVMSKKKTVVKKLSAIQNFGAMDILCTDKTGTLTMDKIIVERHLDVHGNEDDRVLRHGYLNSYYQTGLKNLMDIAILEFGREIGFKNLEDKYEKVDEIPFDFTRRRMSVVLKDKDGKEQLITKGAVEEMLSISTLAEYEGKVVCLTDELKKEVMMHVKSLNSKGMRVIGIAQKNDLLKDHTFGIDDENNMVLMGFIGFLDPPKESAKEAIKALNNYGVNVKILTGDNEIVTRKICEDVGLNVDNILLGIEIEDMSDEEILKASEYTAVFAKLAPIQKARIIKVLKNGGKTVGFMGDGINDAIALKESDVGISVDTAVDIAKEAADIILLEKDLMVLENGVIEGRRIFGNIKKYIKMTASSNFGNVFSVLIASVFLPFLPMMPVQLLLQNLIYDISQVVIPWDNVDEDFLKEPRKWSADDIGRFMVWFGPTSSIFDILTFLTMWFIFGWNSMNHQAAFHTGWFIEGLATQILVVYMLRTKKIPFIQSNPAKPIINCTILAILIGFVTPFTAIGSALGFTKVPLIYFGFIAIVVILYCLTTQFVKNLYIEKFKTWL